jgi:uncharacterized protein YbjT (DUF2867 family)
MKIVLTGSLGNISKPLAQTLITKGHTVTIISSKAERENDIIALGAKPSIGVMEDPGFLAATFKGADVVYLMVALNAGAYFDPTLDLQAAHEEIVGSYVQAVQQSGVKQVIHLSSIGAHAAAGVGLLVYLHQVENALKQLPPDVSIKFMRPVGFYYNMFAYLQSIKSQGLIVQNYGGDEKEPWVSPLDIAEVIAEEVEEPFNGRTVRYIASDEASPNEVAKVLGEAIGEPGLKWLAIPDEQMLAGMIGAGMNPAVARGLVEMNASRVNGKLYEDYYRHRPTLGKTKLKDFAKKFAKAFIQ